MRLKAIVFDMPSETWVINRKKKNYLKILLPLSFKNKIKISEKVYITLNYLYLSSICALGSHNHEFDVSIFELFTSFVYLKVKVKSISRV